MSTIPQSSDIASTNSQLISTNPDLVRFVKLLASHPFYKETGVKFYLDWEAHKERPDAGHDCAPPELSTVTQKLVSRLTALNAESKHIYYRVQYRPYIPVNGNGHITQTVKNDNITNSLYIPIDIDFKLPFSFEHFMTQLGISPWAVVQTSVDKKGFKRYQALVAVRAEDTQKRDEVKRLGLKLASICGADSSMYDFRRVARLPGFRNWKWSGAGVSKLLQLKKPGIVYSLERLDYLIDRAKINPGIIRCKEVSPPRKRGNENKEYTGDRICELTYAEAIDAVHDGKVIAEVGHRVEYVNSIAGGAARAVRQGKLSKDAIPGLVKEMATKGCSEPLSDREIQGLIRSSEGYLERDAVKDETKWRERRATNITVLEERNLRLDTTNIIESNRRLYIQEFFRGVNAAFMGRLYQELIERQFNDGYISEASWVIVNRAEQLKLIVDRYFCVAEKTKSKWGTECWRQEKFEGAIEEGFIGQFVEEIYRSIKTHRELVIEGNAEAKPRLASKLKAAKDKCTSKEGLLNAEKFEADKLKEEEAFFTLKFKQTTRSRLQEEIAHTIQEMQQKVNKLKDESAIIAFQNGLLSLGSSEASCGFSHSGFTECEAWRNTLTCMDTNYDTELASRVLTTLQSGDITQYILRYEQLLIAECPTMYGFLKDTFPEQQQTWLLVMNIIGYCFLVGNPRQKFFNFQGATGSGKGSLGKIITYLSGDSSQYLGLRDFSTDTGLFPCIGKSAAVVDEVDNASMDRKTNHAVWETIKKVTGGTPVSARRLYKDAISVRIDAKFILISNKPLDFPDEDGSIGRRLVSLKFKETCAASKMKEDIALDVLKSDADKVATIAAATLMSRWYLGSEMFQIAGSSALDEGKAEYLDNCAPIRSYLLSCLQFGSESGATAENGRVMVVGLLAVLEVYCATTLSNSSDSDAALTSIKSYLKRSRKQKEEQIYSILKVKGVTRGKEDRARYSKGSNDYWHYVDAIRIDCSHIDLELVMQEMMQIEAKSVDRALSLGSRMWYQFDLENAQRVVDGLM